MTTRVTSATPHVLLDVANNSVEDILFIPTHNLIVTLSDGPAGLYGKEIRVFDRETDGKPNLIRETGTGRIECIVNLVEDVVASLYCDGRIITWSASTGNVISAMKFGSSWRNHIERIDDNSFLFLDNRGKISVVIHDKGNALKGILKHGENSENWKLTSNLFASP